MGVVVVGGEGEVYIRIEVMLIAAGVNRVLRVGTTTDEKVEEVVRES